jgi:hypothetical protein
MRKSLESFPAQPEALHSEHLKDGIKPIMACVGSPKQFDRYPGEEEKAFRALSYVYGALNIDFEGKPEKMREQGFKQGTAESYVISPVDSQDKFSKKFYDCTGIVVAGRDKKTGDNVSLLCHQDPKYFLKALKSQSRFSEDLVQRMLEIRKMCFEGTIDALIWGGNYLSSGQSFRSNYMESIKFLSEKMAEILNFNPAVAIGPKLTGGPEQAFYANKERRLYLMRPRVGDTGAQSYSPTAINMQEKKWIQNI